MKEKNKLYELVFFITSRCNSSCSHCFNRNNLNSQTKDLSLEEINNLSKNLPKIDNLLLSGGEPFLRNDLPELIKIFKVNNNIKTVSIPTNGLLVDKIIEISKKILEIEGLASVNINLSIDGLAKTHDQIRGVSGNFDKIITALSELSKLRKNYDHLNILINSVITKDNYRELFDLHNYLVKKPGASNHFFEIIRPMSKFGDESRQNYFSLDKLFYNRVLSFQYGLFKSGLKSKNLIKNLLHKIFFLGKFSLIYKIQHLNFKHNQAWPFICQAGKNILVLNSHGRIRPCELRDKDFSLNENFKEKKIIDTSELSQELKLIQKQKCFCTHVCFIDASINNSLLAKYFLIPIFGFKNYIMYEYISHHTNI